MNPLIKSFKRFSKTSLTFFLGVVLSKIVSFFMLPIYTRYLEPSVMGQFDLYIAYSSVLTPILFLEIWSAMIRFLYDSDEEKHKNVVIASQAKVFRYSFITGTTISIILYFIFKIKIVKYIYLITSIFSLSYIYQFAARGLGDNIGFAVSGILNTLVLSISNIILIIKFNMGIQSLVISTLLGSISQILFLEYRNRIIKRILNNKSEHKVVIDMVKYAIPLSINSVSFWFLSSSNKVIIRRMLGAEGNGIYAVSQKFSNLLAFVTLALNYAWQDIAFSRVNKRDGEFYSKAFGYYSLFMFIGAFFVMIATKFVAPIMIGEDYTRSINIIPLGVIAAAVSGISSFLGNIFGAIKKTKDILISTIISSLLNIILTYILIAKFGIIGANIALLISFTINVIIRVMLLNKYMKIKINYLFAFISIIICVLGSIIFNM